MRTQGLRDGRRDRQTDKPTAMKELIVAFHSRVLLTHPFDTLFIRPAQQRGLY
jgi:hypothetical protein